MAETLKSMFGVQELARAADAGSNGFESGASASIDDLTALAQAYLKADQAADALGQKAREARQAADKLEGELLALFDQAKIKSIKLDNGSLVTSVLRPVYSLPPKTEGENRTAALAWLRRVGAKELVEPSIHQQTLTKFLREREDAKLPISPLIKRVELRSISVRNSL